jgi:hypothetical protein
MSRLICIAENGGTVMRQFVRYIALLFCGPVFFLDAYIYNAVVMRKWSADVNRYCYFIGLGDFHDKQHDANKYQLQELRSLLASVNANDIKILTEDLSVPNDVGRNGVRGFSINSRGGLLGGITDLCRNCGINTCNVEYRYARVCALSPMLNNAKENPARFASVRQLRVSDLIDEVATELNRAESYADCAALRSWYFSCMRDIEKKMTRFGWYIARHKSVADYLVHAGKSVDELISTLLTFDAGLLDIKIVHEIIKARDVQSVCAIAGGSHIERVSKALNKVGYTQIWRMATDGSLCDAIDAGPTASRGDCDVKPAPISLSALKKFF